MQKIRDYRLPIGSGLTSEVLLKALENKAFLPLLAVVVVTSICYSPSLTKGGN